MASPHTRISYDVIQTPTARNDKDGTANTQHPPSSFSSTSAKRSRCKEWFFGIPGILCGALVGIIVGCAIQTARPSAEVVSWIGIPGTLFIRAIKCLVTPLVFCSLLVGMADMLAVGKASRIGWRTGCLYLFTTIVATCEGLVWVMLFRPMFGNKKKEGNEEKPVNFAFQCEKPGFYLTHNKSARP